MSDLHIRNLHLQLQGKAVLSDFSLHCQVGEFVVLAGPSGSGKSSLLRAIAGLLPITQGEILCGGKALHTLPPGQRDLALVFQDHALMPHLNVAENLAFGLRARGTRKAAALQRAEEVAERLELSELLERKPGQISGGEQQRVALGRAMLREARLVLMDEPMSSLDAPLRARLRRDILKLHREQGWTTLYVTHDQAEALSMADRLGVLQNGRLLQVDTPSQIYRAPASLDVARFVGHPMINLLPLAGSRLDPPQWQLDGSGVASHLLGLRAEDLQLLLETATVPEGMLVLSGQLADVEFHGDQQLLRVNTPAGSVQLRHPAGVDFPLGQRLSIAIDPQRGVLFDATNGQAVTKAEQA